MFFRKRLILSLEDRARIIYGHYINKKLYIEKIFSMDYETIDMEFLYELRRELDKRKIGARNIEILISQEKFAIESLALPKLNRKKTRKLVANRLRRFEVSTDYRRKLDLRQGEAYDFLQIFKIRKDFILNLKDEFKMIGLEVKKLGPVNFSLANMFSASNIDRLYDCSSYNILLINLNNKYLDLTVMENSIVIFTKLYSIPKNRNKESAKLHLDMIEELISASISYIHESFNIKIDSYILIGQLSKDQDLIEDLEGRLNISFMEFNRISSMKN